jgi:hypothetical protein
MSTALVVVSREDLRELVMEAVREVLAPTKAEPEVLFAKVPDFAKRIDISERHVWDLVKRGLPTIGSGCCRRVDVRAALEWMRVQKPQADDCVERSARRAARRAALRAT